MLGQDIPYERLPYLYSDLYDLGLEYNGYAADWDRVVLRGDRVRREFLALRFKDRPVLAAMNVNIWDHGDEIKAVVRGADSIDPDRLADPSVLLADLA